MVKNEFKTFRSGLKDGVLAAQIIQEWSMSAQIEESLSVDPKVLKHHHDHIHLLLFFLSNMKSHPMKWLPKLFLSFSIQHTTANWINKCPHYKLNQWMSTLCYGHIESKESDFRTYEFHKILTNHISDEILAEEVWKQHELLGLT